MFQVSSVMLASGHLTSLLTLGVNTGLVMDVGYTETLVVPVSLFVCLVHINFTAQSTLWVILAPDSFLTGSRKASN